MLTIWVDSSTAWVDQATAWQPCGLSVATGSLTGVCSAQAVATLALAAGATAPLTAPLTAWPAAASSLTAPVTAALTPRVTLRPAAVAAWDTGLGQAVRLSLAARPATVATALTSATVVTVGTATSLWSIAASDGRPTCAVGSSLASAAIGIPPATGCSFVVAPIGGQALALFGRPALPSSATVAAIPSARLTVVLWALCDAEPSASGWRFTGPLAQGCRLRSSMATATSYAAPLPRALRLAAGNHN